MIPKILYDNKHGQLVFAMSDEEIINRVWQAQIPTGVKVASNRENSKKIPNYYCKLFRNSYLPMYYEDICGYFKNFDLDINQQKAWFTYNGVALKWNYPIGLLYDYLAGSYTKRKIQQIEKKNCDIWELQIHVDEAYPSDILPFKQSMEYYWMNQIKESCYVLNGSSKNVMSLSKDDSARLWMHAKELQNKEFYGIYFRKIASRNPLVWKRIPVKLYLPNGVSQNWRIIQDTISPYTIHDDAPAQIGKTTLGDILGKCLPEFMLNSNTCQMLIHGIIIDPQAPLGDLYQLMMFNDGFLHIVVLC